MSSNGLVITEPTKEQKIATAIDRCSAKEKSAYKYFLTGLTRKETFEIPSIRADELYKLYANGKSCEEIIKISGSAFSLGQIVAAKIVWGWDAKLDEYRQELLTQVPDHVKQVQLESADVVSDLLAACNMMIRGKIQLYLQSGKEADLVGTPLERGVTMKTYNDLLLMLGTATGQDNKPKKTESKVTVTHEVLPSPPPMKSIEDSHSLLDSLVSDNKVK